MRRTKSASLRNTFAALLALAMSGVPPVWAQQASLDGQRVTAVRVVDGKGAVLEQNPPNLPLRAGKPYDTETEREALRQLFATGLYSDIHTVATAERGGVRIDFVVERSDFIGLVQVAGLVAPPNEARALAALGLNLGQPFTEDGLKEGLDRLKQTLADDGLYQAAVSVARDRDEKTRLVSLTVLVKAGPRACLGKITFHNQSRFGSELLLDKAKLGPGKLVTSDGLSSATDRLRKFLADKNYLTARVAARRGDYDRAQNRLPLTIDLEPGPEVSVVVEGARVGTKQLQKLIPIYEEGAVDPDLLEEGRRNLRDYFERQGYFNSQVSYQIRDEPQRKLESIIYDVHRGAKSRLVGVAFTGNHYFGDELLTSLLSIQPASFLSPGLFSPRLLTQDEDAIRGLYQASGFRDVDVKSAVRDDYQGHAKDLFVRFTIKEGAQARVSSLKIEGNPSLPSEELLGVVGSTAGQPYSPASIANDRNNILALYYNSGFPNASFEYQATPSGENQMALTYTIHEGAQVRVGQVLLLGYEHTRPGVIRRQVLIAPGKPLRESDVVATQDRLYNLGIFDRVDISTKDPSGSAASKDVLVVTREGDRYTLGYGGGVEMQRLASTSNATATTLGVSPLGIFEFSMLNVAGRAQTLSFKARVSTLQYRGLLSYQVPNLLTSPKFNFVLTGFADKVRDVNTFTGTRYEGSLQLAQTYSRATTFLYRYTFRHVLVDASSLKINPEQIPLFSQPTRISGFGFTWIRDRRDNPADASSGSYNTADFSIYSKPLGSSANFGRLFFQNSTYTNLGNSLVLARSTRFGVEEPYGRTTPDNIPLPERFFAGGGTSIRGFSLNQAGPRDPVTGFPVGGLAELVFNQELRFPMRLPYLGTSVGGALLYDVGNVYSRLSSITLASSPSSPTDLNFLSHTVGFGFRYNTPVGPVRLDLGYLLNPAKFQTCTPTTTGACQAGTIQLSQLPRFQFFFNIGSVF